MRRIAQRNGPTGALQLFHNDTVRLVPHPQTANVLVGRDTQQPRVAELLPHVRGEVVGLIGGRGNFLGDFATHEILDAFTQLGEVGLGRGSEAFRVFGGGVAALGEGWEYGLE